jgi:hypothetical protein
LVPEFYRLSVLSKQEELEVSRVVMRCYLMRDLNRILNGDGG